MNVAFTPSQRKAELLQNIHACASKPKHPKDCPKCQKWLDHYFDLVEKGE